MSQVKAFLNQTKDFFIHFEEFLEFRVSGLAKGAQGESRYISQWVGMVGQDNAQAVLAKLKKYEQSLDNTNPSLFLKFLEAVRFPLRYTPQNVSRNAAMQKIEMERVCKEVVRKITAQLERAQEFLTEIDFNSANSAVFLPVNAHKQLAERARTVLNECNKVLKDNDALIAKTIPTKRKSWFTETLRRASYLVSVRLSAWGLSEKSPIPNIEMTTQQITENNKCAHHQLNQILEKLENLKNQHYRPTKVTRTLLGCETATDKPTKDSLHYQYVPSDLEQPFENLKMVMKGQSSTASTTGEQAKLVTSDILTVVKTPFPEPKKRYR